MSKSQLNTTKNNLAKTTIKEVNNRRLKKGARTVNNILHNASHIPNVIGATTGIAALGTSAAPLGALVIGANIASSLAIEGRRRIINYGLHKLD